MASCCLFILGLFFVLDIESKLKKRMTKKTPTCHMIIFDGCVNRCWDLKISFWTFASQFY